MPRVLKTVVPRIRRSLEERGLLVSLRRSILLPIHLFQEYRTARKQNAAAVRSDFDRDYDVDTDGEIDGWTHLSDLDIPSANWIYGRNYAPIDPTRFHAVLSSIDIRFEDFVFIDFGSGKGRALLLASKYRFRRIVGVEFSPELHLVAQHNIRKYMDRHPACDSVESVCLDFLEFSMPKEPSVFFFFDPCEDPILIKLLRNIRLSLDEHPRSAYLVYVAPTASKKALLDAVDWLVQSRENAEFKFCVYEPEQGRKDIGQVS
jgi:SAM-dependent methyltransferase